MGSMDFLKGCRPDVMKANSSCARRSPELSASNSMPFTHPCDTFVKCTWGTPQFSPQTHSMCLFTTSTKGKACMVLPIFT